MREKLNFIISADSPSFHLCAFLAAKMTAPITT